MLCSLHFCKSTKKADMSDEKYDRPRKQRILSDMLNESSTKFYELYALRRL
jgi:hypothetical protein